jgi:hypothetical protein
MTAGPTRARIRSRRWLTAIIAALMAVAVQLALVVPAGAATSLTRSGATVTVEVNGLPRHVRGNVKLTARGKKSRRITATTTVRGIAPGTYTVSAQPVVWAASAYHPTITLCSASGRCSSPSHGLITVKAHQHVTVHVTYAVRKPVTPPSSPSPVGRPQPSPQGTLAPKGSGSGGWSVTISVPAGGPQTQADAVVSFPIPLGPGFKPKLVYRNETQALEPKSPCLGSPNEPVAEPGFLCVYRGGNFGSKESEDANAKFLGFQDPLGQNITQANEGVNFGPVAVLIVFRTTEFNAAGEPLTLAKQARLTASGSWALTAP